MDTSVPGEPVAFFAGMDIVAACSSSVISFITITISCLIKKWLNAYIVKADYRILENTQLNK
jgi:hypothetical protein